MKKFVICCCVMCLSFSVFAIQGNGVLCTKNNPESNAPEISKYSAFWFVSDNTFQWFRPDPLDLNSNGDKFEFVEVMPSKHSHFSAGEDKINLRMRSIADLSIIPGVVLSLNRYNLELEHWVDAEVVATYKCTLQRDRDQLLQQLKDISDDFRAKHETKLKRRKI